MVNVGARWEVYSSHKGPPWAVEPPGSSEMPVPSPPKLPTTQRPTLKAPNPAAFEIDGHPSPAPVTELATTESFYVASPLASPAGTGQMRTAWDAQTLQVPRPPMVAYHLLLYTFLVNLLQVHEITRSDPDPARQGIAAGYTLPRLAAECGHIHMVFPRTSQLRYSVLTSN